MSSSASERYNISLTALMIGVPVLVGASYYYYYLSTKEDKHSASQSSSNDKSKKLSPHEEVMHHKQIGNQNFSRKYYQAAIEHYNKGIELAKDVTTIKADDLAIFYQNRAACNESLGNLDLVIADCNEALQLRKGYTKAYVRRAKAHEKLEDFEKATVDAFCASLLEKYQDQNIMLLTDSLLKASSAKKAAEAMKTHKPCWPSNSVIKGYFSAYVADPVKDHLGADYIHSPDQLDDLIEESKRQENSDEPFWILVRGTIDTLMGNLKQAEIEFDKLIAMPEDQCPPRIKANALIKKASIAISETTQMAIERDIERSLELLDQASSIDRENPDIYLHKSQVLTLAERLEEAQDNLAKALEYKPDFHTAAAQKFYMEFKSMDRNPGKMKKLLEDLKEFVDKHPDSLDLHQMYAQILTEIGEIEQADQVLSRIIERDPSDATSILSRALLQVHLNTEKDDMIATLKQAIESDPKLLYAYEILGSIEIQRGNQDEAIKIFETALKFAQCESDYGRCYSMIDSAKCQMKATEILGLKL